MDNTAVFEELYSRYKSCLYGLACYLTRNQREAEDLFQETWLRIAKHLAGHTIDVENCRMWMMTITSNLYRDWLRKKRVRRIYSTERRNDDSPPDFSLERPMWGDSSDLSRNSEHQEIKMALSKALSGLPPRHRIIFVLKEIEGYQYNEICEIMKIPEGTVKSILHRALKKLRRDLWAYNPKKSIIASV